MVKENYNVLCTDIQYKEGVLEFLEANSNVDYIILNEDIDGNISLEDLIAEIKKINKNTRIIFTSNKSYDEEKIFNILRNNIEKTYKPNFKNNTEKNNYKKVKPEIKEKIAKKYNYKNKSENYHKENLKNNKNIYNNKTINIEKNKNLNENKYYSKNNENIFSQKTLPFKNLFNFNQVINKNQKDVIAVLGPNGIGKSVFSILFAKTMESKKCLIIDFDVLNKSLHTMMGVKNYEEKIKRKIKNNDLVKNKDILPKFIIHTNLKIDLLPAMNIILDPNYKLSDKKMKNIIDELKQNYDLIIIDTSSETFLDYTKELVNCANKAIFISGANILEVRKSERLLEIYNQDWNIDNRKINIVFNKCTDKSLDDTILREIFNKYNILGKIQLSDYYDFVINKKMTEQSKLQKEIKDIKKQIIKEKYYGVS